MILDGHDAARDQSRDPRRRGEAEGKLTSTREKAKAGLAISQNGERQFENIQFAMKIIKFILFFTFESFERRRSLTAIHFYHKMN